MNGGVDLHRYDVGVLTRDFLVHFEEVAVFLGYYRSTQFFDTGRGGIVFVERIGARLTVALDGVGKVKIHGQAGWAYA